MAGTYDAYLAFSERREQNAKKVTWYFNVWGTKNCPDWYEDGWLKKQTKHPDGPYAYHGECFINGRGLNNPLVWYEFNWNLPGEEG